MPLLSAADAVSPAMERAKSMLLPFRFKTWLKMGFIGWLAGELASGSFNFSVPANYQTGSGSRTSPNPFPNIHMSSHQIIMVVAGLIIFFLVLAVIFTYLFSRFRFILFDSVLNREVVIGRGWHLYRSQAERYFLFWLVLGFFGLMITVAVIGLPILRAWRAGVFQHPQDNLQQIFMLLGSILLGALLLGLIFFVVVTLAKDFLVPFMALDNLTVGEAWTVLKTMLKAEPVAFLAYLGLKFVLYIASAILLAIVMVLIFLVLLIPGLLIGVLVVVAAKMAGAGAFVYIVLAVLGGLAAGVLAGIAGLTVSAPFSAFFGAYTLYFMGGRYPKLGLLLWPPPPPPSPVPA